MKKIIALALAVMLVAALAAPALAEETQVIYTKSSTYTVSIPAAVDLSDGAASASITATAMNLAPKKQLAVTVVSGISEGKVTLTDADDSTVTAESTVSLTEGGEGIADNAVVAVFRGTDTAVFENGTLFFSALPEEQQAGTYSGTITFSMAVTEIP